MRSIFQSFLRLVRLAAILVGGGVAVAFSIAALAPRFVEIIKANDSTSVEINLDDLALRSVVYDRNGDEFDVLYDVENRALVELDAISGYLITSVLVVEDEGFWDHNGVDAKAIGRAFVENVNAGGIEQGGSTITQQLIKNGEVRRGWLGVHIQSVTDEIAESLSLDDASGAMVASVVEDGPAASADLKVMLSWNSAASKFLKCAVCHVLLPMLSQTRLSKPSFGATANARRLKSKLVRLKKRP